jgi:hypothetical protein
MIQWLTFIPKNIASIFGLIQGILKVIKELLSAIANLLAIIPGLPTQKWVESVRNFVNIIDAWVEKIKGFFLGVGN